MDPLARPAALGAARQAAAAGGDHGLLPDHGHAAGDRHGCHAPHCVHPVHLAPGGARGHPHDQNAQPAQNDRLPPRIVDPGARLPHAQAAVHAADAVRAAAPHAVAPRAADEVHAVVGLPRRPEWHPSRQQNDPPQLLLRPDARRHRENELSARDHHDPPHHGFLGPSLRRAQISRLEKDLFSNERVEAARRQRGFLRRSRPTSVSDRW
jgi:hypothetical protein